jgi:hypothetical protein
MLDWLDDETGEDIEARDAVMDHGCLKSLQQWRILAAGEITVELHPSSRRPRGRADMPLHFMCRARLSGRLG